MYAPLAALSSGVQGFRQGQKDQDESDVRSYELMGIEALGRAFQADPNQGPQPPAPGQPSMPAPPPMPQQPMGGPMAQGPMPGGQPPLGAPPMPMPGGPPSPGAPAGGGPPGSPPQAPPPGAPPMSPGGGMPSQGGMPQLDLQSLVQRIQKTSPGLPPQAMVSALTRAAPLLNVQGRQELAQLRMQMQQQGMDLKREGLDLRRDAMDARQQAASQKDSEGKSSATEIVDAMKRGEQPPTLTGLYKMGAAVRTEAAKQGFNLAKAQQEWAAAQKQIQSLNGPQMTRYAGLATSVVNTIDEVKSLSEEMANSGIPLLNRAKLQSYIQLQGNSEKGQLAARYMAGINTLKEEFANLAQGGYAPTESAWGLANQQINGDYGVKQLSASLDEVQRLIRYRLQGIPNFQTLGPSAPNRYTPGGGGSGNPAPAQPAQGGGDLPDGWSVKVK